MLYYNNRNTHYKAQKVQMWWTSTLLKQW
jgi:hypothetical protein